MKPFLLLWVITVYTPDGVSVSQDKMYTPSQGACLEAAQLIKDTNRWVTKEQWDRRNGLAQYRVMPKVYSKVKTTCIPMRGQQR
jgi:hypothetical protein